MKRNHKAEGARRGLFVAILLSMAFLPACGGGGGGIEINGGGITTNWPPVGNYPHVSTRTDVESVPVSTQVLLSLDTANGNVSIVGVPGSDRLTVAAEIRVSADSPAKADDGLQAMRIQLVDSSAEIALKTLHPTDAVARGYEVNYTITLPPDLEVLLAQANGDVSVESMERPVRITLVNGGVDLANLTGRAFVRLVNGSIFADVRLPHGETIDMRTSNGSIDLTIPEGTSGRLDAACNNGTVRIADLIVDVTMDTPRRVTGTLGDGSGRIDLEVTGNGGIRLTGVQ